MDLFDVFDEAGWVGFQSMSSWVRALEAGMSIAIARVDAAPLSVDTPEDLARARGLLQ